MSEQEPQRDDQPQTQDDIQDLDVSQESTDDVVGGKKRLDDQEDRRAR